LHKGLSLFNPCAFRTLKFPGVSFGVS
jgi:hypothetical protein